jgi:spore coat protein H
MGKLLLIILMSACLAATAAAEIFDSAKAHAIQITMSADAWDAMQPGNSGKKAAANATREQGKTVGVRLRPTGPGYAYVISEMEFDGKKIADVGIRFKGNSSYSVSNGSPRRPMKVDFDRFVEGERFDGVETFNLSNTTFDPSRVRESLSFWLYRKMNVPTSRTGFANVYLSVAGKYDREYLGLYTLIEEIDQQFLKKHFGNIDGLLLKPSGMRGFAYLGDKWENYAAICNPKSEVRPELAAKVVELARLIHRASDAEFAAKIGKVLAVDQFLRYVAVTGAIISFDSFLSTGHNYYIYVNPTDGLIYFLPWDVNMSLGGYGWVGTVDELARTDINRPYADHNILVERLLKVPQYAADYRAIVNWMVESAFNPEQLAHQRKQLRPVLAAADTAAKASGKIGSPTTRPALGVWHVAPDLWPFAEKRAEWIRLQVAGRAVGFKPDFRDPKRTLDEWAPLTVAAVNIMDGIDADHDRRLNDAEVRAGIAKLFSAASLPEQSLMDGPILQASLDRVISEELKKRVPASAWASWIIAIADANKDGKVSSEELFHVYKHFQAGNDADRDGMMDGRELVEALQGGRAPRDPDPKR